ncbi:GerMN domain-containing protein [Tumebacillus sp. ITR2]|uniref:GerMN domain-containing protein n=1 Tax=Tumebacillus amylolyticus TaxID=2801339 RepID=A0ABS1JEM0_9BACL|nr:GerMN domain-containing protein [Tumebacillus amylolyticus]MBL0388709.1 GerMN domain-containing protein [Tumebacillus amylolyticus]
MKKWNWVLPLLVAVALTGCGSQTSSVKDGHPPDTTTQPPASNSAVVPNPPPTQTTPPPKADVPDQDKVQVAVYKSDANATKLVKETATIAKMSSDSKRAAVIFGLLKEGNPSTKTIATVPAKVELLSATVEGGTLTLNFNDEATRLQGSTTETMFVDAVNKTMFDDFQNVTKIKYQINGKDAEVLTQLVVKDGFKR